MGKKVFIILLLLAAVFAAYGQSTENEVLALRRNFVRANLSTKLELVKAARKTGDETSAPFFISALDFVDSAYEILQTDETLMQIGIEAVNALAALKVPEGLLPIKLLYMKVRDDGFSESCVRAFAAYKLDDQKFIGELNKSFETLLYKSLSGQKYSASLLLSYIDMLGAIGNSESFSLLFKAFTRSGSYEIKNASRTAISKININFFSEVVQIILKKDLYSTWAAFQIAKESSTLSETEMSKITEMSLQTALDFPDDQTAKQLVQETLALLTKNKWQNATDLVVEYFYRTQYAIKDGKANASDLVTVIDCMARLDSKECANALVVFLGLVNAAAEKGQGYNEAVVLAAIKALGDLGDSNAFDYLVYVAYLNYSESIKKAARESIARLKW